MHGDLPPWAVARIQACESVLLALLRSDVIECSDLTPSILPQGPGLYAFRERDTPSDRFLRAGITGNRKGGHGATGLRMRVYHEHMYGQQPGNLRPQLAASRFADDLSLALRFIRHRCTVQVLYVPDGDLLPWYEDFMLAVLRPDLIGPKGKRTSETGPHFEPVRDERTADQ